MEVRILYLEMLWVILSQCLLALERGLICVGYWALHHGYQRFTRDEVVP